MRVLHPSSDDARKNTTHRSRRSSINQSLARSLARRSRTFSSSGAYVKSPVIADTASDVGNVLHTASRRQSPLGIEPRINESHGARITDRIASHRIAPRNDVHQTRAIARASDGVGKPSHRSNARGRRVHAHDPRARRHVDDALFFFLFSLSFFRPLSFDAVSRDGMSPVIARRRFISLGRDDASSACMNE